MFRFAEKLLSAAYTIDGATYLRNRVFFYKEPYVRQILIDKIGDCIRKHFFSNDVIPAWNSLPTSLVSSPSIQLLRHFLKAFDNNDNINIFMREEN